MGDIRNWLRRQDQPDGDGNHELSDTELDKIWAAAAQTPRPPEPDTQRTWRQLAARLDAEPSPGRSVPSRWWLTPIAAGCMVLLYLAFFNQQRDVWETQRGQQRTISLADGSEVTLNAESILKVDKGFGQYHRTVTVQGEAFFSVNAGELPFIVHAGHCRLEVIGTQFNVWSRREGTELGVFEGVVELSLNEGTKDQKWLLQKGQRAYCAVNDVPRFSDVLVTDGPPWLVGNLNLNGATVQYVCDEIQRRFDIEIHIADPAVAEKRVTGMLSGQDADAMIQSLCYLTGTSVTKQANRYTLR